MSALDPLLEALDACDVPGASLSPAQLEAHCQALLRQLGQRSHLSRQQAARLGASLRLLRARASLPEALDWLLRVWLERTATPPALLEASAALLDTLEMLPASRARPLVRAWMERLEALERERHHRQLPSRGACWRRVPERAARWLQARIQDEAAQRRPDVSLLLFWLHSLHGLQPQAAPLPEADLWLEVVLRVAPPEALQARDLPLLAWWPRERLEPLLVEAQPLPWRWVAACPTAAMARRVVSAVVDLPRRLPLALFLIEQALDSLGPLLRGPLVQALCGDGGEQRHLLLEAAARQLGPWAIPALAASLSDKLPRNRELASAAMASLGSPEALEACAEVARGRSRVGQRAAAQTLLRWPQASEAVAVAACLRPGAVDAQARRTLQEVLRRGEAPEEQGWATLERGLAQVPAPTAEEIRQIQRAWTRPDYWLPRLEGDRAAVLRFYLMLQHCKTIYMPELHEIWIQALRGLGQDALAPLLALKALDLLQVDTEHYLQQVAVFLGKRLEAPLVQLLLTQAHPRRRALYRWLCEREAGTLALHQAMLQDSAAELRRQAAQAMAQALPGADDFLLAQLKAPRAQQRQSAAEVLALLGDPEALPAVQAALAQERAKGARAALEAARLACDPAMEGLELDVSLAFGAYSPDEALELRDGLEQLRSVMHDVAPSPWTWARLCNLLDRFRDQGQLWLALDYVQDLGLDRWPEQVRVRPSDWGEVEALAELDLGSPPALQLTAQALLGPRRQEVMFTLVRPMQDQISSYKLRLRELELFAQAVAWAWAWCQENGATPDLLELRVDEGIHNTSTRQVRLALHLVDGFLVQIAPTPARKGSRGSGPGLRLLRLKPPGGHPIRQRFAMDSRARYLDLAPLFQEARQAR